MSMLDKASPKRRVCPVIFLLDTAGSMAGAPLGAVNAAMESVLPELISMNNNNPDAEIEIAVMTFETGISWVTGSSGLVNPESHAWNDLNAGGGTSMGAAFRELNKVLSVSHDFMYRASGSVAPVFFLLTDGEPTDNYQDGLQALKGNNWYKVAARVAIGYGQSNDAVLREFTGNPETVLHTNDPKDLKNMIRFVTITSTMMASTGKGVVVQGNAGVATDPNDTTNAVADALKKAPPTLSNSTDPDEEW
jgi:uncharacterized protein YegL